MSQYQYSQNLVQSTNVPQGNISYSTQQAGSSNQYRTLIDSSSPEHPIQLATSNQVVSQILTTTQGSPTRQSKTFVYRSESPIRSSTYGRNVVSVSRIEKGQAPIYVSQSTTQNPIYVEKIVKVESSNTSELNLLRQRISSLELQNKTLTEEVVALRNNTPQEVEQIVYIENNDEINKLKNELSSMKFITDQENDHVKRSKKDLENQHTMILQERDRMIIQLKELTVKLTEFQSLVATRDLQITTLKSQNEALSVRLVLTTAELERVTKEKVESEPLKRKVADLESYLIIQEKTIEELRLRLGQQDQVISQLRMFEIRCTQYEQEINGLKLKIEEFLRTIQNYQNIISQKDEELNKLRYELSQFQLKISQLGGTQDELENLKRAYGQKSQECEDLRRKCAEYDILVLRLQQLEAKLQESEQNSLLLIKKIEELQAMLNDEGVKRSKKDGELSLSLRDKQALEEKLVHLTQQIEFLTRKVTQQDQDINQYRLRINELENVARQLEVYEQKINFLNQQVERLNQILVEKDQVISKLTIELNQLKLSNNQIVILQEQLSQHQQAIVLKTAEVESLRKRLSEYEIVINQLRIFEGRSSEYENLINALRQRIQELEAQLNDEGIKRSKRDGELSISLRDKASLEEKLVHFTQQIEFLSMKLQSYEKQLQEKDAIISQLRIFEIRVNEYENIINQLRQRLQELEGQLNDESTKRSKRDGELNISLRDKQALEEKLVHLTQQIEFLSIKVQSYEKQLQEKDGQLRELNQQISSLRMFEIRVQEYENIINQLRQRLQELEGQLNDESTKRSKRDGELNISLRDKQALEEKLVHLTQQIEFLSIKVQSYEKQLQEKDAQLREKDQQLNSLRLFEIRVQEYENIINQLRQRLQELEGQLNDEVTKRSKRDGEFNISLRDKQALEEKLVHLTQQIEFLSIKVQQQDKQLQEKDGQLRELNQQISSLRMFEIRVKEYENVIQQLRQRIQELEAQLNDEGVKRSKRDGELSISLRDKQALEEKLVHLTQQIEFLTMKITSYEKQIQDKDTLINQLRIEISQLTINLQHLGNAAEEVKRLTELLVVKTTELDQLRKRLAELEYSLSEFRLVEAKLQECEKNNQLLRQRIAELEAILGDEASKRSRNQSDLEISLRDKQALEEKLVHLTQQIEFLSRKVTQISEENLQLKSVVGSYQQIIEEWSSISIRHNNFSQLLENLKVRVQQISFSSSSQVISTSSYVRSSGFVQK